MHKREVPQWAIEAMKEAVIVRKTKRNLFVIFVALSTLVFLVAFIAMKGA